MVEHGGLVKTDSMRYREEWPLFCVTKYIAEQAGQVWVYLTDLPPLEGHPDGLRRLFEEMHRLERCLEREGIIGWLQLIAKDNARMRGWTEMVGGILYATDDDNWHFKKVANAQAFPRTPREAIRQYRGDHCGTA